MSRIDGELRVTALVGVVLAVGLAVVSTVVPLASGAALGVVVITGVVAASTSLISGIRLTTLGWSAWAWRRHFIAAFSLLTVVHAVARDSFPTVLALSLWVTLLFANLTFTTRVRREPNLDPWQRRAQLAMIWALPLLGVILVGSYYRSIDDPFEDDGFENDYSDSRLW